MTDTYTLGPISAGSDSFLGGLFGFAQGISSNFALGQQVYVNNPQAGNAIISGQNLSPAGVAAVQAAAAKPRTDNPFVGWGQNLGSILGAGFDAAGTIIGVGGQTAGPGVASGAAGAAGGAATIATSGIGGALSGVFSGGLAGVGNALGTGPDATLLIAGGLVLVLLYLLIK